MKKKYTLIINHGVPSGFMVTLLEEDECCRSEWKESKGFDSLEETFIHVAKIYKKYSDVTIQCTVREKKKE